MGITTSLIYCENIQTEITLNGQKEHIINPLSVLCPISIPSNFSFAISCSINGLDLTKLNKLKIEIVDAKGKIVFTTNELQIPPNEESLGQDILSKTGVKFSSDLRNLPLTCKGIWKTIVYVNDETPSEYPIEVVN